MRNCDGQPLRRPPTLKDVRRFISKLRQRGACWEWTGYAVNHKGYGGFWYDGKMHVASRFATQIFKGLLAMGMQAHHCKPEECIGAKCCNPLHLAGETVSANAIDANARRSARKTRPLPPKPNDSIPF
jgi:hypothetical protein